MIVAIAYTRTCLHIYFPVHPSMSILLSYLQAIPPNQSIQVTGPDFLFSGLIHTYDDRWLIVGDGEGMYLIAIDAIETVEWYPENTVQIIDPKMN